MTAPAMISRRRLLQLGGVSALTMATPGIVAARLQGNETGSPIAARKSCIFVLLCGGPSHLDTWDLKPDAPDDIRGPYRPIATTGPRMRICELNTRLSTLTQHFSLIRPMPHLGNSSHHVAATHPLF